MKALQCVELAGPEKLIFGDVEDLKPSSWRSVGSCESSKCKFS